MNRLIAKTFRLLPLLAGLTTPLVMTLMPAGAHAQEVEYLQGISDKAQDAMREGLAAALRKLPKCNPHQLLENGECCQPGFVSLGKECVRIAPPTCASVAIENPESCNLTRCAKFTRTVEKEVPAIGEDGKPIPGQMEKKNEEVPCEPWNGGIRDLTCELETYDCTKEELAGGPRWCGDWVKEIAAAPQVDAGGKPIAGAANVQIIRCKPGSDGCSLDVRECMGSELKSGKSDGAGPCKVGEYVDPSSGKCSGYKCPAQCTTADGRCDKCGPDYKTATDSFKRAADTDKRFYEAYFNLGMAYERMGRYQDAISTYEAAKAIAPNDDREKSLQLSAQGYIARAWLAQARRLEEAGELDKAKALREQAKGVAESIRGQDPDNTMANVALGLYYLETGEFELAEGFVKTALRNNREDTIALNIRGLINLKLGKLDIARWILEEKVLALDPANPEALANLGLAYVKLGDLPKAVVAFERAVRLAPSSISARMNLGAIYLEYLNYRDADRQYGAALKLEPDNLEALTGYALTLEGKREPKKSAEIYERVLAKDPSRVAIMVRLALIYNKAPFNDGPKSIAYWERYLKAANLPQVDAVKLELDAMRSELKTKWATMPKKAPPDWAKQKAALVAKEQAQTTLWKNILAITSRIDAIKGGMQLEKEAKDPKQAEKAPDAKPAETPAPK